MIDPTIVVGVVAAALAVILVAWARRRRRGPRYIVGDRGPELFVPLHGGGLFEYSDALKAQGAPPARIPGDDIVTAPRPPASGRDVSSRRRIGTRRGRRLHG